MQRVSRVAQKSLLVAGTVILSWDGISPVESPIVYIILSSIYYIIYIIIIYLLYACARAGEVQPLSTWLIDQKSTLMNSSIAGELE